MAAYTYRCSECRDEQEKDFPLGQHPETLGLHRATGSGCKGTYRRAFLPLATHTETGRKA